MSSISPPIVAGSLVAVYSVIDRKFFLTRAISPVPGGYQVQHPDGAPETVERRQVVPIPAQAAFKVGDDVLALWQRDVMFPGTITAISPQGYMVAWHDGDPPLVVRPGTLTYLSWADSAMRPGAGATQGWTNITAQVVGSSARPPPLPPIANSVEFTIFIPGDIRPVERGERFVEPLEDALGSAGKIVDEGTKVVQTPTGPRVEGCYIRIAATPGAAVLPLIRQALLASQAPLTTTITEHGAEQRVHRIPMT